MADDRDAAGKDDLDPWASLDGAGGDDGGGDFDIDAFSFADTGEQAPPGADPEAIGFSRGAGDDAAGGGDPEDAITAGVPAASEGEPAGEAMNDSGAGISSLVGDEASGDADDTMLIGAGGWDDPEPPVEAAESCTEQSADSFGLGEFSDASESGSDLPQPSPAVAAPAPARAAQSRKPRKKGGGIGQMIGIVLGGAMAIPVTLAILVWGFGKDPFGTTKHVPKQLAFLLPAKFQRGGGKGTSGGDDLGLPIPPRSAPVRPAADPEETLVAPVDPADAPVPPVDPEPEPTESFVDPLDVPAVKPPAPVAPPAPPPPDTTALVAAVGEAEAAGESLRNVSDEDDPARKPLLREWYKRLATVAEELVLLEHTAADTGRALTRAPEEVDTLHAAIAAHGELRAELARLGRMWLTASKRNGDGVVLPVTFESARRVGPYWSSQVTLQLPKGETRRLVLVSRGEPGVVAGDVIVVTGVILGEGVIWAADVRGPAGDPASPF